MPPLLVPPVVRRIVNKQSDALSGNTWLLAPGASAPEMEDARLHSPSAARNRDAILAVLRRALPSRGIVLEIASGTGEHVVHFAAGLPGLTFQPSDPDAIHRASVDARIRHSCLPNIRAALDLDTTWRIWPIAAADAVFCSNMIHIAPWPAALGLIAGAAQRLSLDGSLFLYGPFQHGGQHSAESNLAFDADLKSRDADWGVRDLEIVAAEAARAGFAGPEITDMPANNLLVMFRRK